MKNHFIVACALALIFASGTALAGGQESKRVGAFGKGGSPAVRGESVLLASDGEAPATKPADKYVCPMKCSESDKPGKCPKCGMELKKHVADKQHQHGQHQ